MSENKKHIGQPILRREDKRLLTGQACFVDDVLLNDPLYVGFSRSSLSQGQVSTLNFENALEMPGVEAAFQGSDVCHLGMLTVNPVLEVKTQPKYQILAHQQVHAVGQPVAAVIAASPARVEDALELLVIDYVEGDCPPLDATVSTGTWKSGNLEAHFEKADYVVETKIRHPRLAPSPMETRGIAVQYLPDSETLTVWISTQSSHRTKSELLKILGIESECIRVVAPDVGGAFGMKASLYPEEVFTVWAALKMKRSMKWTASRNEDFLSATHGRGAISRGKLALTTDGDFLALRADFKFPLGQWLPYSGLIPTLNAGRILPTGYNIEAVDIRSTGILSNTAPVGIYRGAGRPEANGLMERLVDEAAHVTGIDPITLRQKNLIKSENLPHKTPTGSMLDSGYYSEALELLKEQSLYEHMLTERGRRRELGEFVGIGISFYVEPCGKGWESACIDLNPDNRVVVKIGGSSQGHGRETAFAQIVADHLGIAMDRINVFHGDTKICPEGIGAFASRSTAIGGSALVQACEEILQKKKKQPDGTTLSSKVIYETKGEAWGYGCVAVFLSIDIQTGVPTIESVTCIDDVGKIINPMMVEGQIMGGLAQGIGEALMEHLIYDNNDQLLIGSFMDYAIPRASDIPPLIIAKMSDPTPYNTLGARGVGESGAIGIPVAIMNAAVDAFCSLGKKELQMPITSQTFWKLL